MARGADLLRASAPAWGQGGSYLLLNPRLPVAVRDRVLAADFPEAPGRVWLATSGTGGVLKMAAFSPTALEASARAVNAHLSVDERDVWLNPLPLFHAGGLGIIARAALSGAHWEPCGAWSAASFMRRAEETGATLASLVPAQVHDLAGLNCRAPASLRAAVVGGAALDESLLTAMRSRGWNLLPSYGLTEAASQVATASPQATDSTWLPLLPHLEARLGEEGVLEIRTASLLDGYMIFAPEGHVFWQDPKVDGWLRTGDRAELRGRELRVLGRADDMVKIRGELVDIAALEKALQARVTSGSVALQSTAHERNGRTLFVVAENEPAAFEARTVQDEIFPPFARPQSITVGEIKRTALGKLLRA